MPRKLIVEADGGSRGNPGIAGSGAVVLEAETGAVLVEIARFVGVATNNVAEYVALIAGLSAAYEIDHEAEVLVRMDSKLVVEQMAGSWKIKHPDMIQLAIEAREIIKARHCRFEWIPREQNSRADALANRAMDDEADSVVTLSAQPGIASTQSPAPQASVAEFNASRPSSVRAPEQPTEPLTTLYLVRHGRTALTESKRISGGDGDNPPLSKLGQKDAAAIAKFISTIGYSGPYAHLPKVDAVAASPIVRASQTAATIAESLGLPVAHYPDFIEVHFGEWDGLTNEEAEALDPAHYQNWRGSWQVSPPGGESLEVFDSRIQTGLRRLLAEHAGQAIVLVSHTMPVRGILRKVMDAGDAGYWRPQIAPCSLSIVRFWGIESSELVVANSTAHLS